VIWNATLGTWVAVSELAKGKTKSSKVTKIIGAATIGLMVTFSPNAMAAYTGGSGGNATGTGSIGIAGGSGSNVASATGTYAIAIGNDSYATANSSTAFGSGADANGTGSLAVGNDAQATQANSTAVGAGNHDGTNFTAATAVGASAFGYNSKASGINSTAIGYASQAKALNDIAIGNKSIADSSTGQGQLLTDIRNGNSNPPFASGVTDVSSTAIAIGNQNNVTFGGGVGIGSFNKANTNFQSVVVGAGNISTGTGFNTALGISNAVTGVGSVAVGLGNRAASEAIALGRFAYADGVGSIAQGRTATSAGTDSIAIGNNASSSVNNSIAIGKGANATTADSVALGSNTTTTAASGTGYLTGQPLSTSAVVSVGNGTANRRIQNLADGALDSDAVTVAQLKDVNNRAVGNTNALGGGAAYNPLTDTYTKPIYNVTTNPFAGTKTGDVNTVAEALTGLDTAVNKAITVTGNSGTNDQKLGSTLNIKGGSTAASSNNNVKTVITGNTVDIQIADAPTFAGQVKANGFDANSQKIINVNNGALTSTSKEAINGSQLFATNTNVTTAQTTANNAITNASIADGKAVVAKAAADTAQATADTALSNADTAQATADQGLNFKANNGTADNVKLGETITFSDGKNTTAEYDAATNTYKYNIVDAPVFAGTVTSTGLQVNGNSTVTGNSTVGGTQTVTGISNLNGGAALNNKQITGLASGGIVGTNAANISDVQAAKTIVTNGTNVTSVTKVTSATGQDTYTVNADGTSVSTSSALTVSKGAKDTTTNVTDYALDLSTATKSDIQKGIDAKTAVDNTGLTFNGDSGSTGIKKLGDSVAVTGDTNITTVATATGVQVKLNPNLNVTNVTAGA
ncbi:ESPR-type extended signal peptide-containing protein, partial [Acinetobacter sp. CFCC 10889]|uniref:ESPR-type extended signal peptide-containing protein n=1 Tax=Acinetobacter sp. CFCC 10889 TaxID=1775557 RepID=UPI002244F956